MSSAAEPNAPDQQDDDPESAPTRRRSRPRAARYSALTPVVVLLALLTVAGRAYLGRAFWDGGPGGGSGIDFTYTALAAGTLVLLAALYAPLPLLPRDRLGMRLLLGAYTVTSLAAYLVVESGGRYTAAGLATVALDVLLILALLREARRLAPQPA